MRRQRYGSLPQDHPHAHGSRTQTRSYPRGGANDPFMKKQLVLPVDTSGSIGQAQLEAFKAEACAIPTEPPKPPLIEESVTDPKEIALRLVAHFGKGNVPIRTNL